jgi:hypothetical protein
VGVVVGSVLINPEVSRERSVTDLA